MYWSELAISTIREELHPLLMRAAYMHGADYLPLGQRALSKIAAQPVNENHLRSCGLRFLQAGNVFVAETENGKDVLVLGKDYAALFDDAISVPAPHAPDPSGDVSPEKFATSGIKTIAQIAEFTQLPATSQMKSLAMVAGADFLLVLLRGDHQLNEAKLRAYLKTPQLRQATGEELRAKLGADAGSLGPVGVRDARIIADESLRGRRNMIAGANQNDFHLRHVTPGRDFACEYADLRRVNEGDTCVNGGPLTFHKVRVLDSAESILQTAAEQHHDADGLCLPETIAPFQVLIAPLHPAHLDAGKRLHDELEAAGIDVLLDDRDVRPGVKFKDADLIGIPYRLNLGKKLAQGEAEMVRRSPREITDVKLEGVLTWLRERMNANA